MSAVAIAIATQTLRVRDLMMMPATCGTSASLESVMRALFDFECGVLLVVDDDGLLAGMLTEKSIQHAMTTRGIAFHRCTVTDLIERQVFSCSPNDTLECAADLMRDLHITSLPVTDALGRPVGVLSIDQVLPELEFSPLSHFDREAMRTLATSCDSHQH